MKILLSGLVAFLFLNSCGVKQAPISPERPPEAQDFDCSIYDPECPVKDPKYDPACDPALKDRPAICEIWNQKYEKAREQYRNSLENRSDTKPKTLSPADITP